MTVKINAGAKILDGLRDALSGNFSRVTIEGQVWVRLDPAATPRTHADRQAMAETIHKARWPADRQMAVTPFEDEDRNGREYCFRIADAVLAAQCTFDKTGDGK